MTKSRFVVLSNTEVALQCQDFVEQFDVVSEMIDDCIPTDVWDSPNIEDFEDDVHTESNEMAEELRNLLEGATQAVFKTWYKKHTGKTLVIEN